jgi:gluconolactonase
MMISKLVTIILVTFWHLVYAQDVPEQAQVVDQISFNVLRTVLPPSASNLTSVFLPPSLSLEDALAKPFHIYDDAFYDIIGPDPSLTIIATSGVDPLFHEAVVW